MTHLLGLIVPHNADVRQHLTLQDLPCILDTLLLGYSNSCSTLANVVKGHLQPNLCSSMT